ncbi:MAG: hypothetical protein PVH91_01425 [Pseudomonadales bacterium]|jgi:hypothetical protein
MNRTCVHLVILLVAGGCTGGGSSPGEAGVGRHPGSETAPGDLNPCSDPRPEICTQIYAPVCATHADGSSRTYGNDCSACADPAVTGWLPGACPN